MSSTLSHPASIILDVEDDDDDVNLLRLLLRKAGIAHPTEYFRDGEQVIEALSKLVETSLTKAMMPLTCFLDVKMPAVTGHDVLRWIRSQRALDPLPVVMLSSSDHPEDIKQAAQAGAQCYLAKYPQPTVLREVISEAERFALGAPADECFRMPTNLLLVRGRRV
jgi:CheY-like chemotaxis protein